MTEEPKDPTLEQANGAAHDDEPAPEDDLEPAPDPRDAPPPPAVAELAAACVRFVASKYQVPLDFEPETLSLVDQYVRDARADLAAKPETLDLLQASIGAYVGETMRRAFGATWYCEGDHDGWRLDFTYVFLTFNPIGVAREALTLAPAEGWHAFVETDPADREDLEKRLESLGQIEEEEYYAPSTRFDVVEIAVDALRAKMIEDGNGDVTFGPEDYGNK
jgi:hypothetical protein